VLFGGLLFVVLLLALVTVGPGFDSGSSPFESDSLDRLLDYRPPAASLVFDRDGREIGQFFVQRRRLVSWDDIPEHVAQAFVASEDARFFQHGGLDFAAVLRAAWANLRGGRIRQGASTITQQTVRNVLLTPERSWARKFREAMLALEVERHLDKNQILLIYLNQIYFGNGSFGIGDAAESYFGKSVSQLDLSEAALLAGLPQRPTAYAPNHNPEAAEARRRYVLDQMLARGFIDREAHQRALANPPSIRGRAYGSRSLEVAEHFTESVRRELVDRVGSVRLYRGGLRIETTLDLELQREARAAVRRGIDALSQRYELAEGGAADPDGSAQRARTALPEGALVSLDVASGDVLAMVGGYDFEHSEFNRAVQARRQPGSAFKPLVYAAAIESGYSQASFVIDSPTVLFDTHSGVWRPRNYGRRFRGWLTMRRALAQSVNNATIRLAQRVGIDRVVDVARRLGIQSDLNANLSLALGSSEVSLLELTGAYAAFADGGRPVRPRLIRRVLDRDGAVLIADSHLDELESDSEPTETPTPGVSPQVARVMTDLLQAAIFEPGATGARARQLGRPVAGKTGTTNGNRDAWFVGYSPEVATGVWVGFDRPRSLGPHATGGRAALPIWVDYMAKALESRPPLDFATPEGVVLARVNSRTGLLSGPNDAHASWQAFLPGTEPTRFRSRSRDLRDARYALRMDGF